MQHATFHGTGSMGSSKKSGSSDPLSLEENKEEFTEGKAPSIKWMNFYYDLKKNKYIKSLYLKDFLSCKILLW